MKLLFDHHLSRKLVARLSTVFPDASHVVFHGLDQAEDNDIWLFARLHGYTIVTKDSDYYDISAVRGAPPQIVWIRIGNCTTSRVEEILRMQASAIQLFITQTTESILEIVEH